MSKPPKYSHVVIKRITPLARREQEGTFLAGDHIVPPLELQEEKTEETTDEDKPVIAYNKLAKEMRSLRPTSSPGKLRLTVLHNTIKPPKGKEPPCGECKTAICCYVFMIGLTKEEYHSGLYGDHAVAITPEMLKQFGVAPPALANITEGIVGTATRDQYLLEGAVGVPCPFLTDDAKCGIYNTRPAACRVYTCVDDERITPEMRESLDLE